MSLSEVLKSINKKYGEGTIVDGSGVEIEAVSTGCYSLDNILGCGGLPKGRLVEVYGEMSCIAKDTFISYQIRDKNGRTQNCKGGTIQRLYERFHKLNPRKGGGYYQRKQTVDSDFYVASINENGAIIRNKVENVFNTGRKECFKVITAKNYSLICTEDHKFYVGNGCYLPLKDLNIGSVIYVHNNTHYKGREPQIRYKEICVKYHPYSSQKEINGCIST